MGNNLMIFTSILGLIPAFSFMLASFIPKNLKNKYEGKEIRISTFIMMLLFSVASRLYYIDFFDSLIKTKYYFYFFVLLFMVASALSLIMFLSPKLLEKVLLNLKRIILSTLLIAAIIVFLLNFIL